jgi:hypothetical protein
MFWTERVLKRGFKSFEEGLNDVRCRSVDEIAYQIDREYRKGVDIAQKLIETLDDAGRETLSRDP